MTTTFADLFERAAEYDVSAEAVNAALVERRSASGDDSGTTTEVASDVSDTDDLPRRPRSESGPCRRRRRCARSRPPRRRAGSRGARRATLARVDDFGRQRPAPRRRRAVVASLADDGLAADWRGAVEAWREPVAQPAADHPALASAYRGGAMQVVSLDPSLTGPQAAAGLRNRMPVSVREPRAFATVFSPARLYPEVGGVPGSRPRPALDGTGRYRHGPAPRRGPASINRRRPDRG